MASDCVVTGRSGLQGGLLNAGKRNGEDAAAFAAAAMLAPTAEAVDATPLVVQLGYASLPIWHQLVNSFRYQYSCSKMVR